MEIRGVAVSSCLVVRHIHITYLEVLRYLTDEPLKGKLSNEKLCRFLVATDFTQRNCTRSESVRLFHTAGGGSLGWGESLVEMSSASTHGSRLTGSFRCQLFTRGLP